MEVVLMANIWGEIGSAAGKVWGILSDGKPAAVTDLKKKTKLDDATLNMALGWLVREDKIILEKDKKLTAKLK
jgi:hypothetical protein